MNIQRKYSLPNCTLLLEGLSAVAKSTQAQDLRPELSILVNAECKIAGYEKSLAGGREFFESLVRAVSAYAQEFLSSIPSPQAHDLDTELVSFEKLGDNTHKIIVSTEVSDQDPVENGDKSALEMNLNTVQLFDLVEAIDQFFADTQTLPELTLSLQPAPRQYNSHQEAFAKEAVPATVGAASVVAAAIAFGLMPVPELTPPNTDEQSKENKEVTSANNTITNTATTPNPTVSPSPINTNQPVSSDNPRVKNLQALLNEGTEITEASQLHVLKRRVYNEINTNWVNRSEINQNLIYRVGVASDGSIVGYESINKQASKTLEEKTPLPKLVYNPATKSLAPKEPIGQFRVVLTRNGELQVSPWNGSTGKLEVVGERITDTGKLEELGQKLSEAIRENKSSNAPTYRTVLKYRVAINEQGKVKDVERLNQAAYNYLQETPVQQIFKKDNNSVVPSLSDKEPMAHFRVFFQPNGTVDVTPWKGY
ncbi:MAG: DUF4335 domain-containing protein [Cyanobacteria bacterium P01_A01_bin.80]